MKIPQGRCTTQFGKGIITGVYSRHSVLVDGTPRHVKDVRPVRGADATYCSSAFSDDEAPMLYLPREDPPAAESDHSDRGQHAPTTVPRAFCSDEVADSKDLLRAVRCVIPKSGRSVKVTYLGIRSAHERVWLVERKPIWLPRAYLTRGDLEPVRGNLHVCKFLRDLTIIQIRTVTAEWAVLF